MKERIVSNEGLMSALRTIKDACSSNETCETCPMLLKDDYCGIRSTHPSEWLLQSVEQHFRIKF